MTVEIVSIETKPYIDPYHRDTQSLTHTHIRIDPEDMTCSIVQECDNNSTSIDEWNGLIISRRIHSFLDNAQCDTYLKSEDGQSLLSKICDEHTVKWNGNNHVGGLSLEGESILDELVEELESMYTDVEYWTCEEYFSNCSDEEIGISAELTDNQVKELSEKLDEEFLVDDLEEYLFERRNDLLAQN